MCMKDFGRIASLVLALVLTLALGAPALAEETYSITINNAASGHVYEAYQIFRGVLSDGVLTDVAQTGANDIWYIEKDGKEYIIPAIKDVVIEVDVEKGEVFIRPLRGIFDEEVNGDADAD